MVSNAEIALSLPSKDWLEDARAILSRLPLDEHDVALRILITDWSCRHTDGERLMTNPAWQSFDAFLAEDRLAENEPVTG